MALINSKQMKRLFKISKHQAFVGFLRRVKEDNEQSDSGGFELAKLLRDNSLECLKAVLKEYAHVFPKDLPPPLPSDETGT